MGPADELQMNFRREMLDCKHAMLDSSDFRTSRVLIKTEHLTSLPTLFLGIINWLKRMQKEEQKDFLMNVLK